MKHIGLLLHLKALDHKINDLFDKILFCKKSISPVHSYWAHGSLMLSGNHDFESCTMASTSLLTATGRLFHKWPHIFSVFLSGALEFVRCFFILVLVGFVLFMLSNYITSLVPCCDVRYLFRVKRTFNSARFQILWYGVHFVIYFIGGVLHILVSKTIWCCPSFCSVISIFALMLVCVTSVLEFVPSAWFKRFHLYTETTTCCVGVYK